MESKKQAIFPIGQKAIFPIGQNAFGSWKKSILWKLLFCVRKFVKLVFDLTPNFFCCFVEVMNDLLGSGSFVQLPQKNSLKILKAILAISC